MLLFPHSSNILLTSSNRATVLSIPLVLLRQMQLSKRDLYGLLFIIGLAVVTICVSVARFSYLWTFLRRGWDARYGLYSHMMACIEENIAITASCLPSVRLLWRINTEYKQHQISGQASLSRSEHQTVDEECGYPAYRIEDINTDGGKCCEGDQPGD